MSNPRFFVPDLPGVTPALTLPDSVGHHIANVLRLKAGDAITVFDGTGGEYAGCITAIRKKQVEIRLDAFVDEDRLPPLEVRLGLCVLKKDAMDRVLARVTELGVTEIAPLISEHCTVSKKLMARRTAHWQQVVIAACEQCGLNRPPRISPVTPLFDWLGAEQADQKLICVPGGDALPGPATTVKRVSLLSGPEGGFAAAEVDAAHAAGFSGVTFGERILRAETAPLVAIAVLHRQWGDY